MKIYEQNGAAYFSIHQRPVYVTDVVIPVEYEDELQKNPSFEFKWEQRKKQEVEGRHLVIGCRVRTSDGSWKEKDFELCPLNSDLKNNDEVQTWVVDTVDISEVSVSQYAITGTVTVVK